MAGVNTHRTYQSTVDGPLVALGAPQGHKNESSVQDLPDYLAEATSRACIEFATVYLLNRATSLHQKDTLLVSESRSTSFRRNLAEFLTAVTAEPVRVGEHGIIVSAAAARALGFGRGTPLRESIHKQRSSSE